MEEIYEDPQIYFENVDEYENQEYVVQTLKYQPNERKSADRFETVCNNYQKMYLGFNEYEDVTHDKTNKTIKLRSKYHDYILSLNSLMDNPNACISGQLILNLMLELVKHFSSNKDKAAFKVYFFNADCVQFIQQSNSYGTPFKVQIQCFSKPDIDSYCQISPFAQCAYEKPLKEAEIVSALLELVKKFSNLTNVTLLEDQFSDDTRVTQFKSSLANLAKQTLMTFTELSDQLEKIVSQQKFTVDDNELSKLIEIAFDMFPQQSHNADDHVAQDPNQSPPLIQTMKIKQFVSELEVIFRGHNNQFGSQVDQNNCNGSDISTKKYKPIKNLNGNILELEPDQFYCEVMHMVILNSFLESNNLEKSQQTNSSISLRNISYQRGQQSFLRRNLSICYDQGRQKDKLYWVYIGLLIHFINFPLISEDLTTSLLIVLKCLKDAYEKPQDKEDDFMVQYLSQSFRYHLANVARNLNDKYLEKTSKYFQLSKGITNNKNSRMIEFDENEFKISLPESLLKSLVRNENGEIYFTVPVKEENSSS